MSRTAMVIHLALVLILSTLLGGCNSTHLSQSEVGERRKVTVYLDTRNLGTQQFIHCLRKAGVSLEKKSDRICFEVDENQIIDTIKLLSHDLAKAHEQLVYETHYQKRVSVTQYQVESGKNYWWGLDFDSDEDEVALVQTRKTLKSYTPQHPDANESGYVIIPDFQFSLMRAYLMTGYEAQSLALEIHRRHWPNSKVHFYQEKNPASMSLLCAIREDAFYTRLMLQTMYDRQVKQQTESEEISYLRLLDIVNTQMDHQ